MWYPLKIPVHTLVKMVRLFILGLKIFSVLKVKFLQHTKKFIIGQIGKFGCWSKLYNVKMGINASPNQYYCKATAMFATELLGLWIVVLKRNEYVDILC